jgi:hypothetical protein
MIPLGYEKVSYCHERAVQYWNTNFPFIFYLVKVHKRENIATLILLNISILRRSRHLLDHLLKVRSLQIFNVPMSYMKFHQYSPI